MGEARAMSAILPMPALSDIEDANPAFRIRSMSDTETPTEHAELRDTEPPGADDAAAEERMRTILPLSVPVKELISASDSMIGALISEIAQAARLVMQERSERSEGAKQSAVNQTRLIEQQEEIIQILQRTEKSTDANYELILRAVRNLEASDVKQDSKLNDHAQKFDDIRSELESLRVAIPEAVRLAIEPYAGRLREIEDKLTI
jgi:hypothetical protein